MITDINDEENGGKYYGEVCEKTNEDGEKKNIKSGKGKYKWADGREYNGEWNGDIQNGQGELVHANGVVYNGNWVDGAKNGTGF